MYKPGRGEVYGVYLSVRKGGWSPWVFNMSIAADRFITGSKKIVPDVVECPELILGPYKPYRRDAVVAVYSLQTFIDSMQPAEKAVRYGVVERGKNKKGKQMWEA